jgi:hypothetical protein
MGYYSLCVCYTLLDACMACFPNITKEAVCSSEKPVNFHQSARRHIPEDDNDDDNNNNNTLENKIEFGSNYPPRKSAMGLLRMWNHFKTTLGTTFLSFFSSHNSFCMNSFLLWHSECCTHSHTQNFLIYLKGSVQWKMYTAIILSVKWFISSSSAQIFHIPPFYVSAVLGVSKIQYICLFI